MANHLMVDIETLGQTVTAAVIEIGAVVFDPTACDLKPLGDMSPTFERFYARINLRSCLEYGCSLDSATLAWWLRRDESARLEAAGAIESGVDLRSAVGQFGSWIRGVRPLRFWSHGASFDLPILDHAFRVVGYRVPWDFRSIRDTRTLFELAGVRYKITAKDGHTADVDAWHQARAVQEAYGKLRPVEEVTP